MKSDTTLPLVYSCSGCSSAAQMTNAIAIRLDRDGHAEMSCIAGVGGGVLPLLKKAQSGRRILAIDGCHLQCVKHCLAQNNITADEHVILGEHGVKKRYHARFDPDEETRMYDIAVRMAKNLHDCEAN